MALEIKRRTDIIIPIYNAYNCLSECIDSVIENTDLENNGLIIINDKSTDKRVAKLLKEYKKKYPFIKLLENKENLGFVRTVNRGMKLSKNDVLLLNSDTIVTPRWLEKIKECAYSNEMVATVTPLSNNATLASVPNIFEKNNLPKDLSLNEMSKLVEECSYKDYPEIPTAHGFCMFIKRSVLDEVGYFDEESFGKGYGEENDFCFRCLDHGYRHLLCDDTYIYHKESQSFSKKKYELIENGRKILEQRYPQYLGKLDNWNSKRPIRYIGQNIAFELGKREKKKNILILIHDWRDAKNNVGGTTLHVYDLIRNLRNKYNFHVLAPEDNVYKLTSYWTSTESEVKLPRSENFNLYGYYNKSYSEMLDQIISSYSIDAVHIHHMIDHYFDIINAIKRYNLYSIISLHDYYAVCPIINKMYKRETYCGNPSVGKCNRCLKSSMGIENNMIENWREIWERLLKSMDKIICPSEVAKNEILMTYKDLDISVIEHGVDIDKVESSLTLNEEKVVNIAFIGAVGKHKGRDVFEYLVRYAKLKDIKIHLFGITDAEVKRSKYFEDHGRYVRSELSKRLRGNNIKLVCLFSPWPETYGYALTESVACGVPVLATDIGAIGDRVKKFNLGWVINVNSSYEEYAEKIKDILSDKKSYQEKIRSMNRYRIKTTRMMCSDYDKIYSGFNSKNKAYNKEEIKSLLKISDKYLSNNYTVPYPDYSWVFGTLKWRIIDKFKIPKFIKRAYSKIKNR
jgi:GT2 family glycosyltransferase/glycosyltransferase involved in cell wall biosynthesis